MNFKIYLNVVVLLMLASCSTLNSSERRSDATAAVGVSHKLPFICTATQGRQSADLPILTTEVQVGAVQKPLRLEAKPFDVLFNGFVLGGALHLSIQSDTKTFDQAVQAAYWGPFPNENSHVELSRYAAKISCVASHASE